MGKNNLIIVIVIILVVGAFFYFQFKETPTPIACTTEAKQCPDGSYVSRSGPNCTFAECGIPTGDILVRSVPTSVSPGQTFQVTYTSNKLGKWGAIVYEAVSGGCTPNMTKFVIISVEGPYSEVMQFTSPSSGSCTFIGDYNFAQPIIKFPDQTVQIT